MIKQSERQSHLVSKAEVCRQLRVSRSTFDRMRRAGKVPPGIAVSERNIYWFQEDIDDLLARLGGRKPDQRDSQSSLSDSGRFEQRDGGTNGH